MKRKVLRAGHLSLWVLVPLPTVPPANVETAAVAQVLGFWSTIWRRELSSRLVTFAWPSLAFIGFGGVNQWIKNSVFLPLSSFLCLPLK